MTIICNAVINTSPDTPHSCHQQIVTRNLSQPTLIMSWKNFSHRGFSQSTLPLQLGLRKLNLVLSHIVTHALVRRDYSKNEVFLCFKTYNFYTCHIIPLALLLT